MCHIDLPRVTMSYHELPRVSSNKIKIDRPDSYLLMSVIIIGLLKNDYVTGPSEARTHDLGVISTTL